MKYLFCVLVVCVLAGCRSVPLAELEAPDAGRTFRLFAGYSMEPVLFAGDVYRVTGTRYVELEPGMLVRRLGGVYRGFDRPGPVVHVLGAQTVRGQWTTYGINNPGPDWSLMGPAEFLGVVEVVR